MSTKSWITKEASPFTRRLWAMRGSKITPSLFKYLYGEEKAALVGSHFYGKPIERLFRPMSDSPLKMFKPKYRPVAKPPKVGPVLTAEEFLKENPYNGFTVYKGDVDAMFNQDPSNIRFASGRLPVAVDYHVRPLNGRGAGEPTLLATGDVRRSKSFLNGDRFFSPQAASTEIGPQADAVRQMRGTQRYYRTGYHLSSDVPDFEITLPEDELGKVMDRFYQVIPNNDRFVPFGTYAEKYLEPESFKNIPFKFRRVYNPETYFGGGEAAYVPIQHALGDIVYKDLTPLGRARLLAVAMKNRIMHGSAAPRHTDRLEELERLVSDKVRQLAERRAAAAAAASLRSSRHMRRLRGLYSTAYSKAYMAAQQAMRAPQAAQVSQASHGYRPSSMYAWYKQFLRNTTPPSPAHPV